MDAVATAVTEMVLSTEYLPPLVNVSHPRPVTWHEVFTNINSSFKDTPLQIVPLDDWLQRLQAVSDEDASVDLQRIVSAHPCPIASAQLLVDLCPSSPL